MVKWNYLEGGEPFLYYPIMLAGVRLARERDLKTGIVTNAYWAMSLVDAVVWQQPLKNLRLAALSASDDVFHHEDPRDNRPQNALTAADKLGLSADAIRIEPPAVRQRNAASGFKGKPVIAVLVRFRGRAVEKLSAGLPATN
jgi:hypothetical protein